MTSGDWASTVCSAHCISVTFSAYWMTGQPDDWSCDFKFFSKQLDAPSIGMLVDLSDRLQLILYQFIVSLVHILHLCFNIEFLIGHQIMSHSGMLLC